MGELLSAGGLGAERHRLDAVRQDAHAPRLDLKRHALVLVGVLPIRRARCGPRPAPACLSGTASSSARRRGATAPPAPEAAAIFVLAVFFGIGLSK